jgi:serine/threonine-protein kinase
MGVVYKAHELSLNRKAALKVLSQRLSSDEEFIKRFQREAQVIATLNHPNIVNIFSCGKDHGLYYFAMEYVNGKDLGQILQEKTSIPLEQALSITSQVASALDEAGSRGVVHRDIKPSNIMIDKIGSAKVMDFGVAHLENSDAKLTRTGLFLGTPEYASPEHATGPPLDVRSDIYSLGAVLYDKNWYYDDRGHSIRWVTFHPVLDKTLW